MARKFNDAIDLAANELQNVVVQNLSGDPGTGVANGRVYYSTALNALRLRAGGAWVTMAAGAGFGSEEAQDAAASALGAGTHGGITVTYDDSANAISLAVTNDEAFQDVVGAILGVTTGNSGIDVAYEDANGRVTFDVTDSPLLGGQAGTYYLARANHTGSQVASTISDFAEVAQDAASTAFANGTHTGATVTYDDTANSLSVAVTNSPLLGGNNGAYYLNRTNHTGTQTAATISDFTSSARGSISVTDTGTLDLTYSGGAISGAVLDSPLLGGQSSAYHLSRTNHTGSQVASTISDFDEAAQDAVGGMVAGNTETGITVTYDDTNAKVNFAVTDSPLLNGNNAAYYLSRTNHTGTQAAATVSDLAATVQAYTLDLFADPVADINLNSHKITNLATPTADSDAATKAYVDAARMGMDVKDSVRVASTGNVASFAAQGSRTIDGISLNAGDRVLLRAQTDGTQNGIYVVGGDFSLTRAADADTNAEVTPGMFTFVAEGTYADSGWVLTNDTVALGTDALVFAQFSGAGQITAGAGITKTGNTLDVGEGVGIDVTADAVAVDRATNGAKVSFIYAQDLTGGATSEVVTHGLGSRDVVVFVYLLSGTFAEEEFSVEHTGANTVTVRSATTIPATTYRVVVFG